MASHGCIWVAFYKGVHVCRATLGFCSQVYLMPPCIRGFSQVSFKTPPLRVTPGPGAAVLTCEPCTVWGGPIVPSLSALGLYLRDVGNPYQLEQTLTWVATPSAYITNTCNPNIWEMGAVNLYSIARSRPAWATWCPVSKDKTKPKAK